MYAPDGQGFRNELKVFNIQAVSDKVPIRSEACRPVHRLRKERKHMDIYNSACRGEQSVRVYACEGRGRYVGSGECVCTLCRSVCKQKRAEERKLFYSHILFQEGQGIQKM